MSKKARRRPTWRKKSYQWSKGYVYQTLSGGVHVWHKCIERELRDAYNRLAAKQEPLGKEFEKVLYENLSELYVEEE